MKGASVYMCKRRQGKQQKDNSFGVLSPTVNSKGLTSVPSEVCCKVFADFQWE